MCDELSIFRWLLIPSWDLLSILLDTIRTERRF